MVDFSILAALTFAIFLPKNINSVYIKQVGVIMEKFTISRNDDFYEAFADVVKKSLEKLVCKNDERCDNADFCNNSNISRYQISDHRNNQT